MKGNLDKYVRGLGEWLNASGAEANIVVSSRIRVARNLAGFPFPHWAKERQLRKVLEIAKEAIRKCSFLANATFFEIESLGDLDVRFLCERHLITEDLARHKTAAGVAVGDKEMANVLVNEEDHLRIHAMGSGFCLISTLRLAERIDDELSKHLEYSFSEDFGFLTACPTNVGTGLRVSVMVHLPALILTRQIDKVLKAVSQLGMTIRGLYGEGTEALGSLFQISNRSTLGRSEEEIVNNMERVAAQIIQHEKNAEKLLMKERSAQIEDKVFRAYGVLKNARLISTEESMRLLSTLRFGVNLKLLKDIRLSSLNRLLVQIQPAHVQKLSGKGLSTPQRDVRRAMIIREALS
jgi:protein arginine kinase